jgi:hypothetical protein
MTTFSSAQKVTIARDDGQDYGYMLGRTGTVVMKCMKRKGREFYQVKIGRDIITVMAGDLDAT